MSFARAEQRRAQKVMRRLEAIMTKDGDNCSLCRAPFVHNGMTYGGITHSGMVALAGECCSSQMASVVAVGLYLARDYEALRRGTGEVYSAEQIADAISTCRQYVAASDQIAAELAKRAGVPAAAIRSVLYLRENVWKSDDAAWFKANPTRSHRLRTMFPGELETLTRGKRESLPPDHELQVLVRQVEPGARMRIPFCRDLRTPIPDIESVALFDLMSDETRADEVISTGEVAELAEKYANADRVLS